MTNTLHRQGAAEDLKTDYVIFATTAKGINREGSAAKLQEFMRICSRHHPVNMGDSKQGNILQDNRHSTMIQYVDRGNRFINEPATQACIEGGVYRHHANQGTGQTVA